MTSMKPIISSRLNFSPLNPYQPSVSATQQELINLVKLKIINNEYPMCHSACPCGADTADDVVIAEIDRYGLPLTSVLCSRCGTVRIDPYLDDKSLADFYTHIYRKMYAIDVDDSADYGEYIARQSGYSEQLLRFASDVLTPSSYLCEVGCGGGGSVKFMQDHGYNAVGCDYDVAALQAGRDSGVKHLYYGDLSALQENLGESKFDLIYLHHVFEHLDEPISFLEKTKDFLSPDGRIILIVPDISRIDQCGPISAVGNLLMYLHIAHKYSFSVAGIHRLAHQAGYSVDKLEPGQSQESSSPESRSPELWVQIAPNKEKVTPNTDKPFSFSAGEEMLKYFQRTEKLYSLSLCRGQIAYRLSSLRSPRKIADRFKRVFS